MKHLITVLIPTLNAEEFLEDAMQSLAAQTLQDFKVLVLDSGSDDRTRQIACSFPRVEFVDCGRAGIGKALRFGVERAETPLVARMDSDDVSLPHRFEAQAEAMQDREVAIVGGQIDLLVQSTVCRARTFPHTHAAIRRALLTGFPAFCHPTVMFRTATARRMGGYSIPGRGEDLDFFLRLTEAGRGRNLAAVVHRYRLHDQSSTFTSFEEVKQAYSFAVACAIARENGLPEPDAAAFAGDWQSRGSLARSLTRLECFAVQLYRRSRIRLASGHRLRGLAGAAVSVALRPRLIRTRAQIALAALTRRESV